MQKIEKRDRIVTILYCVNCFLIQANLKMIRCGKGKFGEKRIFSWNSIESGKGMVIGMKKPSERAQQSIKKLILIVMVIYFVFVVGFYFLAGDQLRLRQSRGNIPMSNAEAATVELVQGSVVEQTIVLEIQQLQSVSVQWGAYYRTNAGTATIQLINPANEEELMRGSFDISTMVENQSLQIQADQPIETIYGAPLILRMTADSVPGSGITPLITTSQPTEKGFSLRVNGQESAGTI
ncbi:MAG: hypothetical protein RSB25_21245, partial [Acinetobacter sp.]